MNGETLRQWREAKSMTQVAFAELLNAATGRNYNSASISAWETGKRPMPSMIDELTDRIAIEAGDAPAARTPPSDAPHAARADDDREGEPDDASAAPSGSPTSDEPPSPPPGASVPPVLGGAGSPYSRVCAELFEMFGSAIQLVGSITGNGAVTNDGAIIVGSKDALGHAYGRLAETNDTFRRMLVGLQTGGAWTEVALVTAQVGAAVYRNHMEYAAYVAAARAEPEPEPPATPTVDGAFRTDG